MKITTKLALVKHWQLYKIRYIIAMIFLLILISVYVQSTNWTKTNTDVTFQLFKDPGFTAIFGSLVGAIIGGSMSIFAAIYVYKKQASTKSMVEKKNEIYKPLYNNMIETLEILNQNPYPSFFAFRKSQQTIIPHPQFYAWIEIKGDSRRLLIPNYLVKEMDKFEILIEEYLTMRPSAAASIQTKINAVLQENYNSSNRIANLGDTILGYVATRNIEAVTERIFILNDTIDITSEQKIEATIEIIRECSTLPEVFAIIKTYSNLNDQLNELITIFEDIIDLINKKYENHSKLY
ncbi:hypothetical protein [Brevibacillus sp. NRS-1366]|uniref:hypothetical protein n=1 Tax=Brevibacillus sp. NRS-1366 TaxID=3233899 RepID=UPI003D1DD9AA